MRDVNTDTVSVAAELAKSGAPEGYPQVAEFMGEYPTLAMVRRFRGLNARNLLYLQAELVLIEKKLQEVEKADAKNDATKQYSKDYFWLMESATESEGGDQWRLIMEMRDKLREYNDVLIQQTTLAQISGPSKYDQRTMQRWFERKDLGDMPLEGDDDSIWAKPGRIKDGDGVSRHVKDLIAINGQSSDLDQATGWLVNKLVPSWHENIGNRFHGGIRTYRESSFYTLTAILATTLSSLLPVLSIVVLYLVHSMPARLGVIAAFTAGFSFALSIITSASRVENFAATAA
ncbi:hypothetical protein DL98DRAFT_606918 [Cadophora sp. DSE1049]|nr:hypothetical protein DL98DRAFT_606918 [Cadophora sp. DSE1049]